MICFVLIMVLKLVIIIYSSSQDWLIRLIHSEWDLLYLSVLVLVLYFLYKNESGLMMSQSISTEWLMLLPSTRIEHRRSVRSSFLRFGGYTEFVVYTGACPRGWYVLYYVQYNVKRCGHACRLGRLWTAFFVWAKTLKRWPFSGLFFMYVCIRM